MGEGGGGELKNGSVGKDNGKFFTWNFLLKSGEEFFCVIGE
jgi:hypothetical protein